MDTGKLHQYDVKGLWYLVSTRLSKNIADVIKQLRCYSVVRPIMRASHARDWGSNPHSSIQSFLN